jgi:hypothetical protein
MVRGRRWILCGAPAHVQAAAHHVDGINMALGGCSLEPFKRRGFVLGHAVAGQQHPPIAQLSFSDAIQRSEAYPPRRPIQIPRENVANSLGAHSSQQRSYRNGRHYRDSFAVNRNVLPGPGTV